MGLGGSEVSAVLEGWPVGFHAVSVMVLVRRSLASLGHGNHSTDFPSAWYAGPWHSSIEWCRWHPSCVFDIFLPVPEMPHYMQNSILVAQPINN